MSQGSRENWFSREHSLQLLWNRLAANRVVRGPLGNLFRRLNRKTEISNYNRVFTAALFLYLLLQRSAVWSHR
jgi:hypothetical protein